MTDNSAAHKRERRRWLPVVKAGNGWCSEVVCLKPSRWMDPAEPWDLAHDHVNGGYLGPAHFPATDPREQHAATALEVGQPGPYGMTGRCEGGRGSLPATLRRAFRPGYGFAYLPGIALDIGWIGP